MSETCSFLRKILQTRFFIILCYLILVWSRPVKVQTPFGKQKNGINIKRNRKCVWVPCFAWAGYNKTNNVRKEGNRHENIFGKNPWIIYWMSFAINNIAL